MRAPALLAWGALLLVACGSQQFGPRTESNMPAPSASASTLATSPTAVPSASAAAASATAVPSTTASDAPPVPSSTAAAKAPARKTIVARHVLIQWMGCRAAESKIVRTREQARKVADDVLRRVKGGEEFTRLVLDYSDEPGAGRRGGSLPPFGHGTMDKEFEKAAFALAPGEISGIVETPFGFHIIQRLE